MLIDELSGCNPLQVTPLWEGIAILGRVSQGLPGAQKVHPQWPTLVDRRPAKTHGSTWRTSSRRVPSDLATWCGPWTDSSGITQEPAVNAESWMRCCSISEWDSAFLTRSHMVVMPTAHRSHTRLSGKVPKDRVPHLYSYSELQGEDHVHQLVSLMSNIVSGTQYWCNKRLMPERKTARTHLFQKGVAKKNATDTLLCLPAERSDPDVRCSQGIAALLAREHC